MRRYHFEKNGRVLSPSIVQENQAKKGSFTAVKGVSFLSIARRFFFSANVLKKVKIICVCFSRVVELVISDDFSP